jgi:hypothetical protein
MVRKRYFLLVLLALSMGMSVESFGQQRGLVNQSAQTYVISAKAGGVSHTEGDVRKLAEDGARLSLSKNENLLAGEIVETGNGRAEILLNPGSFLRVGPNSRMNFVSTSLEDISVNLIAGSYIFELFADDDFSILTRLGNSAVRLTRTGVFRVDVRPDGTSSLAVVRGRAVIGYGVSDIRSGRVAHFSGDEVRVDKFNRNVRDQLDTWSQNRAKETAKNNARLQTRVLRDSMLSSFDLGGWNFHRTLGVWVYNNRLGSWSFLPFGMGWSSPYGYGLGLDLWYLNLPLYVFRPGPMVPSGPGGPTPNPSPGTQPRTGGNTEGDSEPGPTNPPRRELPVRNPEIPAFRRFEINQRVSGNDSTTPPIRVNRDGGWMPNERGRSGGPAIDSSPGMPGMGPAQPPAGPSTQSQPSGGMERQPSNERGGGESMPIIRDN